MLHAFRPAVYEQTQRELRGKQLLQQFRCTGCHVPDLQIDEDRRVMDVETVFDDERGVFNRLYATPTTMYTETDDGSGFPTLKEPTRGSFLVQGIYADFRRHDLGPFFWERQFNGDVVKEMMTEPLWGVGSTRIYGHDGRSTSLREVILRHGGEAQTSRDAFAGAAEIQQEQLVQFLNTLILFPPDDTASDWGPADPSEPLFPQQGQGSIDLSVMFNDPDDKE